MNPKVSIIIPCYNMGVYLQETIDSVISYPNSDDYELIIVNDGSTDSQTIDLLKSLEDKGFFILNQKNAGPAKARNNGIKLAKGEYILPLDADNRIRHNYISESISIFEKDADIDIIYGNHYRFEEEDEVMVPPDFSFPRLCYKNFIDNCAVFRKTLWEKTDGYDESKNVMGFEDWDFWLRCSVQGAKFYHLNEVTFDYRVRKISLSTDVNHKIESIYNYIFSKKELAITTSVLDNYKEAKNSKHLRNSMEYRVGKVILSPIRFFQKIVSK